MESESGSDGYLIRNSRPLAHGSFPGHGGRSEPIPTVPLMLSSLTHNNSRPDSGPRRKRSTETILLSNEVRGRNQENNTITRQRPISNTSTEGIRIRPTNFCKAVNVAAHKSRHISLISSSSSTTATTPSLSITPSTTSITISSSAGATKLKKRQKSVSKSSLKFKPLRLRSTNISLADESHCDAATAALNIPRKPRGQIIVQAVKKSKAADRAPSSGTTPPTIFNVDHANVAYGTLKPTPDTTSDRVFSSLNDLDDLARWDMDSLPSIPSMSESLNRNDNNNSNNANPGSPPSKYPAPPIHPSNPFADPLDDESLFENEIPFPSNRSRVILENMGVKKSKNALTSKGRNIGVGGSVLNRHSPLQPVEPMLSFSSSPPSSSLPTSTTTCKEPHCQQAQDRQVAPGLPPPLPLRTLCQNAGQPHPLADTSRAPTSTYLRTPTPLLIGQGRSPLLSRPLNMSSPSPSSSSPGYPSDSGYGSSAQAKKKRTEVSGSSATRQDSFGCVHLGAADCELSIMFPQTSHFEVWDMSDYGFVAVPALLCLMAKNSMTWTGMPLAMPDVSLIDLRCDDVPLPVPFSSLISGSVSPWSPHEPSTSSAYTTSFLGGKSARSDSAVGKGMSMSSSIRTYEEEQSIGADKISIDGKWVRTYARPGVEGRIGRQRSASGGAVLQSGPETPTEVGRTTQDPYSSRGWYLKIWVPVPTRLFAKRETRAFRIHARVWMMGDEERVLSLDRYEVGLIEQPELEKQASPYPLVAETEMTVSHLRREREMVGW